MPKSEIRIFTYSLMLIKIHELRIVVALFILNLGFHFNTYFVFFMTGTLCFECLSCPCYNVMNVNVKKKIISFFVFIRNSWLLLMISSPKEVVKPFPLCIKSLKSQEQVDISLERLILDCHTSGQHALFICHSSIRCWRTQV